MASKEDKTFWDALMAAYEKQRERVEFEMAENGCMEETHGSLKRRIHAKWGFDPARIVLMEADMKAMFEVGRTQYNLYSSVRFQVNGKGWATDFTDLVASPAYDEKEKEEEE